MSESDTDPVSTVELMEPFYRDLAAPDDVVSTPPAIEQRSGGGSNGLTLRLQILDQPGMIGKVTTLIGSLGIDVGAFDRYRVVGEYTERDITVYVANDKQGEQLVATLDAVEGVKVINHSDMTFRRHLGGKIEVTARHPLETRDDLSQAYTPGVARVCRAIEADPDKAYNLTIKGNTILIVTDGSRVLALGNIGPLAAEPVMSGKALLFKRFGGVNAVPICLATQDPEEIIRTVKNIIPAYGGVNLEDIASPGCWDIERRLRAELDVPVFHDDQHGTAVVVLAGTLNAAKVVKKQMRHLRVVMSGVGAAGMACARMLIAAGVKHLVGFNRDGAIYRGRPGMNAEEEWLANHSNPKNVQCTMKEALKGADMFLGLSVGNILVPEDLKVMRRDAIVFALANPQPEVDPCGALQYAKVVATGGSEFPNQVNNALAFPGIFRGALDCRVRDITEEMKVEAARALAGVIKPADRRADNIIPGVFDEEAHKAVAAAVRRVAIRSGAARRVPK